MLTSAIQRGISDARRYTGYDPLLDNEPEPVRIMVALLTQCNITRLDLTARETALSAFPSRDVSPVVEDAGHPHRLSKPSPTRVEIMHRGP